MKYSLLFLLFILFSKPFFGQVLRVSQNQQYLEGANGKAFFWLGDTAWELFHKLNRDDAKFYLENRAEKGFTVIQAVVLAEIDGLRTPNAYGHVPLIDLDPARPNEAYFEHVDFVINEAEKLGLFVAILPTWGDKVTNKHGGGPVIFNAENAFVFGQWLGERYIDKPIIWMLGGDRDVYSESEMATWEAMAAGLRKGDQGKHLITYHPRGASTSYKAVGNPNWIDFHTYQSGHSKPFTDVYRYANVLSELEPRKPFLDSEPAYEGIPVEFWKYCDWSLPGRIPQAFLNEDKTIADPSVFQQGFFTAHDVRVHAYWNLLSGACGYTYGANAIWQMFEKGTLPNIPCLTDWREALDLEGAQQMKYFRQIFEKVKFENLVPAQELLYGQNPNDSTHIRLAKAIDNRFILAYLAAGQRLNVNIAGVGKKAYAYWYNPRNGEMQLISRLKNQSLVTFIPPNQGTENDWLLVVSRKRMY